MFVEILKEGPDKGKVFELSETQAAKDYYRSYGEVYIIDNCKLDRYYTIARPGDVARYDPYYYKVFEGTK